MWLLFSAVKIAELRNILIPKHTFIYREIFAFLLRTVKKQPSLNFVGNTRLRNRLNFIMFAKKAQFIREKCPNK